MDQALTWASLVCKMITLILPQLTMLDGTKKLKRQQSGCKLVQWDRSIHPAYISQSTLYTYVCNDFSNMGIARCIIFYSYTHPPTAHAVVHTNVQSLAVNKFMQWLSMLCVECLRKIEIDRACHICQSHLFHCSPMLFHLNVDIIVLLRVLEGNQERGWAYSREIMVQRIERAGHLPSKFS